MAVKDCSRFAVAVTYSEGDAPVRLTSGDLQAFTIERIAHVWRVSGFLTPSCPFCDYSMHAADRL